MGLRGQLISAQLFVCPVHEAYQSSIGSVAVPITIVLVGQVSAMTEARSG